MIDTVTVFFIPIFKTFEPLTIIPGHPRVLPGYTYAYYLLSRYVQCSVNCNPDVKEIAED
jgi:hypothetical protein